MTTLNAKTIVGTEIDPGSDGVNVGKYLLAQKIPLQDLAIDVTDLAPEDLVSNFVNGILHELETANLNVADAQRITWKAKFPSEAQRLAEIVRLYVEDWKKRK